MRLIDADAMIDRLKEWDTKDKTDKALYNFTLNRINEQPTIQPAQPERIKGHWIPSDTDGFVCSVCRNGYRNQPTLMGKPMFEFCPVCGAKMEKE